MQVTLGALEVVAALCVAVMTLWMYSSRITTWRAEINQKVKFLIDEDRLLHKRIEDRDEKMISKLDDIADNLKKLELRDAHRAGLEKGLNKQP